MTAYLLIAGELACVAVLCLSFYRIGYLSCTADMISDECPDTQSAPAALADKRIDDLINRAGCPVTKVCGAPSPWYEGDKAKYIALRGELNLPERKRRLLNEYFFETQAQKRSLVDTIDRLEAALENALAEKPYEQDV